MRTEDRQDDDLYEEVDENADDTVISVALKRSFMVIGAVALLAALVVLLRSCGSRPQAAAEIEVEAPKSVDEVPAPSGPPAVAFTDVTQAAGIDFVHESGARGERFLPETMGAGAAFFDYDNDGDADLLLINSDTWDGSGDPRSAFYENRGDGSFVEVGTQVGLDLRLYGTATAVGDVDGDGFVDVFVATLGRDRLLRNVAAGNGGRRFEDVTASAGVAGDEGSWSSSSAFFDADGDGDLDLFVGNYVRWSEAIDRSVDYRLTGIGRAYGPPVNYEGTFSSFFLNQGDGRFRDLSEAAGFHVRNPATGEPVGKVLGVAPVDLDRDGDLDLIVANDTVRNFVFINDGAGVFEEVGELYGLAYGRDGQATGAMGIDSAVYRDDGELGFAIGNFANEMTSLYVSQGDRALYADEAILEGIGASSRRSLTFGLFFFDYDLDGRLDLLQVNGHLETQINTVDPSQSYRQPPQLYWNQGPASSRTFAEVELAGAGDLGAALVGRSATYADIDLDGDLDVLLTQTGDRAVLLRNDQELGHHWLRVALRGRGGNRDAIGAWIELRAGGRLQRRQVMPTRGYQSQVELPVTFGLGTSTSVEALEVVWPDGSRQSEPVTAVDTVLIIEQSDG